MLNQILGAHGFYSPEFINKLVTAGEVVRHRRRYLVDTTNGVITMLLPPDPAPRTRAKFKDYAGAFDTNLCRISGNGKKIMGLLEDYDINTKHAEREFYYVNEEKGWLVR